MKYDSDKISLSLFEAREPTVAIEKIEHVSIPHPVPYQGSKRKLAARILDLVHGESVDNLYEPFAGSAALTLAAAHHNIARRYHINDSLKPLADMWGLIINGPTGLADQYEAIWKLHEPDSIAHYNKVRAEFNQDHDPAKWLYLLARCVKAAVRFNDKGEFNQSADKRRLGTRPATMRRELYGAHRILHSRSVATSVDYADSMAGATKSDLVYMDPPWQGTSGEKDTRYHQMLNRDKLIEQLDSLNRRSVPFLLSFDGRLGNKTYGDELPAELQMTRLELNAGRSSQATLSGGDEVTFESLYLSKGIADRLKNNGRGSLIDAHLPQPYVKDEATA